MRILFLGDSPTVSTGFSRCSRTACNAMHAAGHDVTVLGMGYYGDPHEFPYPIYPCVQPYDNARSYGGETRLPSMIARVKPDVIVILQDPWNIPGYFDALDEVKAECEKSNIPFDIPPVVGWIAVDSKNQKGEQLERLAHLMVWTKFAGEELIKGGYGKPYDIVPLGVDVDLFYPRDKKQSRIDIGLEASGIPLDAFIVGVVGRNQPRKRLDLTLEYFASWIKHDNISNAYLYMHVAPTGENSCDLRQLVRYHNLGGKVIVNSPRVGSGDDDSTMPLIYSSFDVYMTQSQGEGFGLPALEAMACGVPCILPGHSAFGDTGWIKDIPPPCYKVPCYATALTAPMNANPYTVGGIPDRDITLDCLAALYSSSALRANCGMYGIKLAQKLTWNDAGKLFVESIERFMNDRVSAPIEAHTHG